MAKFKIKKKPKVNKDRIVKDEIIMLSYEAMETLIEKWESIKHLVETEEFEIAEDDYSGVMGAGALRHITRV